MNQKTATVEITLKSPRWQNDLKEFAALAKKFGMTCKKVSFDAKATVELKSRKSKSGMTAEMISSKDFKVAIRALRSLNAAMDRMKGN